MKNIIKVKKGKKYVRIPAIIVNEPSCVIVEIDMYLKRPDILSSSNGGQGPGFPVMIPEIWFCNSTNSYYKGKKINDAFGIIEFPAFSGWDLYLAERSGRYSISVVFIKRKESECVK